MVQKCDDQNVTYKGTIIRDARQSERGNTSTGPLHHSSPSPSHIIQYIEKSRSKLCRGLPRTLRKLPEQPSRSKTVIMNPFQKKSSASIVTLLWLTALLQLTPILAFVMPLKKIQPIQSTRTPNTALKATKLYMADTKENEVVELVDDDEATTEAPKEDDKAVAPFLSQGEISEEAMEMDWKDPKQTRVMVYIILSLLPVLFLIPLMLGSREMIPAEMLPPVPLN